MSLSILLVDNFSYFSKLISELLGSIQRSISPRRINALSSNPSAKGNNNSALGRDIILYNFL